MQTAFKLEWISENRNLLMGIAILDVMTQHSYNWIGQPFDGTLLTCFPKLFNLLFTQTFIFLSGFGISYSLKRNSNIHQFYKKRLLRVFLPFLVLAFPFYLYKLLMNFDDLTSFVLNITALYPLVIGNNGMWYISLIMAMYLFSPFIFRLISSNTHSNVVHMVGILAMCVIINILLKLVFPAYHEMTSIIWKHSHSFVIGMYAGIITLNSENGKKLWYLIVSLIFLLIVFSVIRFKIEDIQPYQASVKEYLFIVLFSSLLHYSRLNHTRISLKPLSWLGKYTLELYILHMLIHNVLYLSFCETTMPIIWIQYISTFLCILLSLLLAPFMSSLLERKIKQIC